MPDDDAKELSALKIEIAEFRVDLRHYAHDLKNLLMRQEGFVPRREIDSKNEAQDARLDGLEDNQTWFMRTLITQWILGGGVAATLAGVAFLVFKSSH